MVHYYADNALQFNDLVEESIVTRNAEFWQPQIFGE